MPVLLAIVFVDLVGFGLVVPLLPFYATRFEASGVEVAFLMATYSAVQLVASPLWGRLSDRVGRRPVLILSLCGAVASYLWLAVADALWMLFAARALAGAAAGNIAAAQAYVADVTAPEQRARGMGLIGAAFGVGFVLGPAIGGLLAGADPGAPNTLLPSLAGAALSGAALLGTILFLKESLPAARRGAADPRPGRIAAAGRTLRKPELALPVTVFFLLLLAFAAVEVVFALWARHVFGFGPRDTGLVFAGIGLLGAAMQGGFVGGLARRYGEERLVPVGLCAFLAGLLVLGFAGTVPAALLGCALMALGAGAAQPCLSALVSRRAPAASQGEALGVVQSAGSLARVIGPAGAGPLFDHVAPSAPFLAGAAVVAAATLLALRLPRAGAESPLSAERAP